MSKAKLDQKIIQVSSATSLNRRDFSRIARWAKRNFKSEKGALPYAISAKVNPKLIAGFRVRVEDWVFEGALLDDLVQIKKLLQA